MSRSPLSQFRPNAPVFWNSAGSGQSLAVSQRLVNSLLNSFGIIVRSVNGALPFAVTQYEQAIPLPGSSPKVPLHDFHHLREIDAQPLEGLQGRDAVFGPTTSQIDGIN